MPIKTFQEYISEGANVPFHERLNSENPNTIRVVHALALGHPEKDAYDVAERKGDITAPKNPVQYAYRHIADVAAAYHDPDSESPFDTKSIQRLIHGHLKVPKRTVKQTNVGYEDRIKRAGGIDKIMKQRQQGVGDREIFSGHGRRIVNRLRSYIDSNYRDHPNYTATKKPPSKQERAQPSLVSDVMSHYSKGVSYGEIAKKFGMTRSRVAGLIHRNKST